ncbi:hypothetical protein GCM10028801_40350 [Nocardioides maradonensis]
MAPARLLSSVVDAPWLPAGSTAQAWVGEGCPVPEPVIIVRLLLTRGGADGPELFTVPTERGADLPTLRLGAGTGWAAGLAELALRVHGRPGSAHRCIGYIRNVVPTPDADYPHATPWAHVPVFAPLERVEPVVEGEWVSLRSGRAGLGARHWWPIVEHHLGD